MNIKTNVQWFSCFVKINSFQKQLSTTKYQRFFYFLCFIFLFFNKKMIPNFVIKFKDEFLKMKIMNGHNFFDEK